MIRLVSKRFPNGKINFRKVSLIFGLTIFVWTFYIFKHSHYESITDNFVPISKHLDISCNDHQLNLQKQYSDLQRSYSNESFCKKSNKRILLITNTQKKSSNFVVILESLRVDFDNVVLFKLQNLSYSTLRRYSLFVVEDLALFYRLDLSVRGKFSKFCKESSIPIIGGVYTNPGFREFDLSPLPIYVLGGVVLENLFISKNSAIFHVLQPAKLINGNFKGNNWSFVVPLREGFEVLAFSSHRNVAFRQKDVGLVNIVSVNDGDEVFYKPTVLHDIGFHDGIKKVIFGIDMGFWTGVLILMDALRFFCHLENDLYRYVQIDIDDVFLGKSGTRMTVADVEALIDNQQRWTEDYFTNGFRFNLGFSGFYYRTGNSLENAADELLVRQKDLFSWFPHMWAHKKPHTLTAARLEQEMLQNVQFARQLDLDTSSHYAIAPFHSGVYPPYSVLFSLWKTLWNVSVTATEEYPQLNPERRRRGFVYRNISVLPRQTCGIFTHTLLLDRYPRGQHRLDDSIRGGALFFTILYSPVSIFMTHFPNYGADRLALYTFNGLFRFLRCFTRIRLVQESPINLARIYFGLRPSERYPLWTHPCKYKRHAALLPVTYDCRALPSVLIIGPQKTGSTALHKFLSVHPQMSPNIAMPKTFEEPQFFGGRRYQDDAIEGYMALFSGTGRNGSMVFYEKSATYFDSSLAPVQAYSLLPDSKVIVLLQEPAIRAHSWYQHMRAHRDPVALSYTFNAVVTAPNNSTDEALIRLRNRCLSPGFYETHLRMWLQHYPANNIILIDAEHLRTDPATLMNGLQQLLPVTVRIDYKRHLVFSPKKRFYCVRTVSGRTDCLGSGKGRNYPDMEEGTRAHLKQYYLDANRRLVALLHAYKYHQLPAWLAEVK